MQDPSDRGQLVGQAAVRELAPRLEHLAGALDRVPEDAGVDPGDAEELQLDRGDHAEAAAAAAKCPEQVRLVLVIGTD